MPQESVQTLPAAGLIPSFTALIEALRPKQWVKNVFVLAPLVFAQGLSDPAKIRPAIFAFICFCMAASGLYLINDLVDRKEDQQHPKKRNRPIASGRLSVGTAVVAAVVILTVAFSLAFTLDIGFGLLLCLYVAINFFYSSSLKHVVVLDVMLIAIGFVLRVVAGSVAVHVAPSHWILLCTFLLALFLGFTKRRHELTIMLENSSNHRPVLAHYSPKLLDQMNTVVLGATVLCYALYTVSTETIAKFHTDHLIYTLPFVIYGLFRYLYLTHQCEEGGSPTDVLYKDRPLILCLVLWALACVLIINFNQLH